VPIHKYDKRCRGAEDYTALAGEVVSEERRLDKVKSPSIQLGPRQTEEGVLFSYYDPVAKSVQLVGDFSSWKPVKDIMVQEKANKVWKGIVPLKPGKYQYKFIVDGEWRIDPYNSDVIASDVGVNNSTVEVLQE